MTKTFPMQWTWRISLLLLPTLGLIALGLSACELAGLAERGSLLGEASDAERWVALVVGALLLPFGLSALPHARLTIEEHALGYLGFGLLCTTRELRFEDVRRWGHATGRNQGRREPRLVFETHDGRLRLVKLAMYRDQQGVRAALTERLGEPAPASATMTGVRFDDPR